MFSRLEIAATLVRVRHSNLGNGYVLLGTGDVSAQGTQILSFKFS